MTMNTTEINKPIWPVGYAYLAYPYSATVDERTTDAQNNS